MEKYQKGFWPVFSFVFPYVFRLESKILKLKALITCFLICLTIGINVSVPILYKKVISLLSLSDSVNVQNLILVYLLGYGFAWTLGQVTWQLREVIMATVFARILRKVTVDIFKHIVSLSMKFHANKYTGAVTTAISQAQDAIPMIVLGALFWIFPTVIEIFMASGVLTFYYGTFYCGIFLGLFFIYSVFTFWSSSLIIESQKVLNKAHIKAGANITDSILNMETVKYFNNQEHEVGRCKDYLLKREQAEGFFYQRLELMHLFQGVIIGLGLVTVTYFSGLQTFSGELSVEDFAMINTYMMQFVFPFMILSKIIREVRKSVSNMQNTMHIMDLKPEIKESKAPKKIDKKSVEIDFDQVKFGYFSDIKILRGVSFKVPAGKTTAIVGATGAGKSTITKLLFRFYDVEFGKIKINGISSRDLSFETLNSIFAIVPQNAVMFNQSLRYNILYGRFSASEEELIQAIKAAKLSKFIDALPDGLETHVGEHGVKLSGGERQRVAIARALLKRPKMFVFDEATSALDTKTEREIQNNLKEISSNVTTLIIAHRLSTVTYADQIVVLEHGKVSEVGSHKQLLAKKGSYYNLWTHQFDSPEFEPEF